MKNLSIIIASVFMTGLVYAQDLNNFSDINIVDEDYGYQVKSYNAQDDNFALELAFGAITNLSEISSTNTISGSLTFYSPELSYNLYGAINTLDVAAVTSFDSIDASLATYTFGVGLSRRTILINDFININSIYDEIQTNITYNLGDSEAFGVDLSGLGFNASYGLIWRVSSGTHFSFRFMYNLMALKSSDDATPVETTASWVSAQAGLGFIF